MRRRAFVATFLFSLLSGCTSLRPAGGYITIRNRAETAHVIDVTLVDQSSQETVLDESYQVEVDETRTVEDAFDGGSFDATISLDDGTTESHDLNVGDCHNIEFRIHIEPDALTVEQVYCD